MVVNYAKIQKPFHNSCCKTVFVVFKCGTFSCTFIPSPYATRRAYTVCRSVCNYLLRQRCCRKNAEIATEVAMPMISILAMLFFISVPMDKSIGNNIVRAYGTLPRTHRTHIPRTRSARWQPRRPFAAEYRSVPMVSTNGTRAYKKYNGFGKPLDIPKSGSPFFAQKKKAPEKSPN